MSSPLAASSPNSYLSEHRPVPSQVLDTERLMQIAAARSAEILKRIEAENIRNVRLVLTDLYGVPRGKVVTAARMERATGASEAVTGETGSRLAPWVAQHRARFLR